MKWFWHAIMLINCLAGAGFCYAKIADNIPAGNVVGYLWVILSIAALVVTVKNAE